MINYDNLNESQVIEILNNLQSRKWIRILDLEGITIKLRNSLQKNVEADIKDVEAFVDEYRELFKGKKPGAMGTKKDCIANMTSFLIENRMYSRKHILNATSAYIKSCAPYNYMYMQQADYFIYKMKDFSKKTKVSKLLQWCEEIESNDSTNSERIESI